MGAAVLVLTVLGLIFFFGGAVGILRFPDFYTRLHAAGKLDTLGTLCLALALALANLDHFSLAEIIVSLKIAAIVVFMFLASPTATHAIVDAGLRAGLAPWTREHPQGPREASPNIS
jgi:multicomponent Na+:H+ antiporter subunit G